MRLVLLHLRIRKTYCFSFITCHFLIFPLRLKLELGGMIMTFKFKAIDHVQLAAPRGAEELARKFFGEILGFEEIEKPAELKKRGGAWFQFGSCQIHVGIEDAFVPAKKAHPAFEVENMEALKEHLSAAGVEYLKDDKLPGANRIYVNDPFGNRIELLEWVH
jgi:catechol 2,3-dioxygenase-like lactoylglutathione lyase family enzyme